MSTSVTEPADLAALPAAPGDDTPDQAAEPPATDMPGEASTADDAPADQATEGEQPPTEQKADGPPSTDVVRPGFLTIDPTQRRLTPDQRATLSAIGIDHDFAPAQVRAFLHFCQVRKLDPFAKDAYLIRYKGYGNKPDRYSNIMSINTYRRKAADTGRYCGVRATVWTGNDDDPNSWFIDGETGIRKHIWDDVWLKGKNTPPAAAKVIIEYFDEQGNLRRSDGVANYEMFVALVWDKEKKDFVPNSMWQKGTPHMLAKCAEALALRKAFPEVFAGTYIEEEMSGLRQEYEAGRRQDQEQARHEAFIAATQRAAEQAAAKTPATPPRDVLEGEVVDPSTVPTATEDDAELKWLNAEVEHQARILGTSVQRLVNRLVAVHKATSRNELPVPALREHIVGLREPVAQEMEAHNLGEAARRYRRLPKSGHPEAAELLTGVAVRSEEASGDSVGG